MTFERPNRPIKEKLVDSVGFGRSYIANPNLVQRLRPGAPLSEVDWPTVYASGHHGYTDYPKYSGLMTSDAIQDEALREQSKRGLFANARPAALPQVVANKLVIKREASMLEVGNVEKDNA